MQRRQLLKYTALLLLTGLPQRGFSARYPQRIATPDRGGTQTLLALGVLPTVSVGSDFYNEMGTTPFLPAGIPDAGDPSEPNLELLKHYQVELIVTVTISPIIQRQLQRVAPVIALDIYRDSGDAFAQACDETRRLAARIGRPDAAERYIHDLNNHIAAAANNLRAVRQRKVMVAGLSSDGRHMTVYGRKSIMSGVLAQMGFEDGWQGSTNNFGFTNAGIESLASYDDITLLVMDYGEDTRAARRVLHASPLWRLLPVVKQRRVLMIPRFEIFGGLPLAAEFTDKLQDALLRPVYL
ncbi:ABC transporter substrate-binding protein [Erwinia sp. S43]|uniref:ABC transporter substrate-binding protein n=1 Tax=Erwinia sp. S43 TaxID=2769339 RepID=UPI0019096261|nr:ABC transporter substrate-binding protein [Erwinia sp. S43]MBK0033219.1 ABC transporter substrate-binding protein [Erwinia sp. S43]